MTSNSNDLETDSNIWVYGYHGTSRSRAERILAEGFKPSANGYDWLGTGVYFWQDAPNHAFLWARQNHPTEPAVIQSRLRIDDSCLDLLDTLDIDNPDFWMCMYNTFTAVRWDSGQAVPTQNPDVSGKRYLDCEFFDYVRAAVGQDSSSDSVGAIRSAFIEGKRIFPNSAIYDRTHVQIAIINTNLIERSCIYEI
jgi:hypothetical protein